MASVFLFVFFLLSQLLLLNSTEVEVVYTKKCPPFHCGNLPGPLGFPFANMTNSKCGVFIIECRDDGFSKILLKEGGIPYDVVRIYPNKTIRIKNDWFREQHRPSDACESLNI